MQHFIKSELDNYFNRLTVFKVFLRLTMHKQPKQKDKYDPKMMYSGEKTILLYILIEEFRFEVSLKVDICRYSVGQRG